MIMKNLKVVSKVLFLFASLQILRGLDTVSGFRPDIFARRDALDARSSQQRTDRPTSSTRLLCIHAKPLGSENRRKVLQKLLPGVLALSSAAPAAHAGEVGARITKAVTQSDLGVAVRRSVVRGAQVMDGVDGQWEQFSDRFGLGSERSKREDRPPPKVIPPPKPLDGVLARALLDRADRAFLAAVADAGSAMIRVDDLSRQIEKVDATVRPSFVRSGLEQAADLPASSSTTQALQVPLLQTGDQFNFVAYTHFKAYLDLLIDRKINFPKFRRDFEKKIGQDVLELLALGSPGTSAATNSGPSTARQRRDALQQTLDQIDRLCQILVDRGLVAQIDTGNPFKNVPEEVIDWSEDLLDLSWSIALDGDITLGSQLLLQEQGLRLYPSFARCAIQTLLNDIPGQQVSVDEYYMDTDYNSDPDRFQVKEVLLNIVLESM